MDKCVCVGECTWEGERGKEREREDARCWGVEVRKPERTHTDIHTPLTHTYRNSMSSL